MVPLTLGFIELRHISPKVDRMGKLFRPHPQLFIIESSTKNDTDGGTRTPLWVGVPICRKGKKDSFISKSCEHERMLVGETKTKYSM
jgi:hypothetical protein